MLLLQKMGGYVFCYVFPTQKMGGYVFQTQIERGYVVTSKNGWLCISYIVTNSFNRFNMA
jgi:hypothetical protein